MCLCAYKVAGRKEDYIRLFHVYVCTCVLMYTCVVCGGPCASYGGQGSTSGVVPNYHHLFGEG